MLHRKGQIFTRHRASSARVSLRHGEVWTENGIRSGASAARLSLRQHPYSISDGQILDTDIADIMNKNEMHNAVLCFLVFLHCPGKGCRRKRADRRKSAAAEVRSKLACRTHRARLHGNIQCAVIQIFAAHRFCSGSNRYHLRMSSVRHSSHCWRFTPMPQQHPMRWL